MLLGLGAGAAPAVAVQPDLDTTKPMTVNLQICTSDTQLDCIESFSILEPESKTLSHIGFRSSDIRTDANGNVHHGGVEVFDYQGQEISIAVELQSPKMVIGVRPDGSKHVGSSLRTYISAPELKDHRFEIRIRTSWLKPQDIQLHAVEADYEIQKIPGGTRWVFSGRQQSISYYNGDWDEKMKSDAKADFTSHRLHFLVHHLGKGGSYFDETCGDKGFTVESHNAPGAGMPFWDQSSRSLNFAIQSPHADALGKPVVGYFRLWMPESYLNCKWPQNSLSSAASIQVFVQNEDGSYQTATTVVGRFKGMIRIEAHGFHYSAPTIQVVAASKPVTKSISSFAKNSSKISKSQQAQVRTILGQTKARSIVCNSTYLQSENRELAQRQAGAICEFAKSIDKDLKTTINVVQVSKSTSANKVSLISSR